MVENLSNEQTMDVVLIVDQSSILIWALELPSTPFPGAISGNDLRTSAEVSKLLEPNPEVGNFRVERSFL